MNDTAVLIEWDLINQIFLLPELLQAAFAPSLSVFIAKTKLRSISSLLWVKLKGCLREITVCGWGRGRTD